MKSIITNLTKKCKISQLTKKGKINQTTRKSIIDQERLNLKKILQNKVSTMEKEIKSRLPQMCTWQVAMT